MKRIRGLVLTIAMLLWASTNPVFADQIAGTGNLVGIVSSAKKFTAARVFAHLAEKHVSYTVFTKDGRFEAVNLFPGEYEVWVEENGFAIEKRKVVVKAGKTSQLDIALKVVPETPRYIGARWLKNRKIESFETIYPPGPGREILERTCFTCHQWNFLPAMPQAREGWAALVAYMTTSPAFGLEGNPPFLSADNLDERVRHLNDADREILLDYLAKNIGPDAVERAVLEEETAPRDEAVLGKAMFVEYQFPNTAKMVHRTTQEIGFDGKGNVWATQTKKPGAVIWLDPRTAATRDYATPNPNWSPHGIVADADDSIWWSGNPGAGLAHMDPKTGNIDVYGDPAKRKGGLSPFFDSKGNVWWTSGRGHIGRWDRKTNKTKTWNTPGAPGMSYGIVIDRQDKVWYTEFYSCALVSFDPKTETFKVYPSPSRPCTARRPGIDSKGNLWYGVYDKGRLAKMDPTTGITTEYQIPVRFATPYDTWVDGDDNVWTSCDNFLAKYDPRTGTFAYYPTPQQTDEPKITITRDGAIWYPPRGFASSGREPAAAAVLYPDKARMRTFAAYLSPRDPNANSRKYKGPPTKVMGTGNDGGGPEALTEGQEGSHPDIGAAKE